MQKIRKMPKKFLTIIAILSRISIFEQNWGFWAELKFLTNISNTISILDHNFRRTEQKTVWVIFSDFCLLWSPKTVYQFMFKKICFKQRKKKKLKYTKN